MKNILHKFLFFAAIAAMVTFSSCEKDILLEEEVQEQVAEELDIQKNAVSILETFESGSKTSYAAGSVALSTGTWYMTDALIGTLSTDRKIGTKSVRIVNSGKLTMQFNVSNGASTVEVYHGKFGTDGNSTWELYMSANKIGRASCRERV